jgi:cell division septation protein DedD
MGPNSFRNLTYLAVLAVVGSLIYLIYQSSQKKRNRLNPNVESTTSLSDYDTLSSISGSSTNPSGAYSDTVRSAVDGSLMASPGASNRSAPESYSSGSTPKSNPADEIKDITVNDPGSIVGPMEEKSAAKSNVKPPKSPATKTATAKAAPVAKFDAGSGKGDYMAVAGAFASPDNANALVAKLKKMGFAKAETVKLENSSSTHVIAGYYEFKGGAEAAVRTLKKNKVDAMVKKRSGEIYKPSAPAPAPKPAAKPAFKPS